MAYSAPMATVSAAFALAATLGQGALAQPDVAPGPAPPQEMQGGGIVAPGQMEGGLELGALGAL